MKTLSPLKYLWGKAVTPLFFTSRQTLTQKPPPSLYVYYLVLLFTIKNINTFIPKLNDFYYIWTYICYIIFNFTLFNLFIFFFLFFSFLLFINNKIGILYKNYIILLIFNLYVKCKRSYSFYRYNNIYYNIIIPLIFFFWIINTFVDLSQI